jgi:arylformamidase
MSCEADFMPRFIEVSHAIRDGMITVPGLPTPRTELHHDHASSRAKYQDRAEFLIANLHLCGNTGTYVDAPVHRYRDGDDLSRLPLERLADLPLTIIDRDPARRAIDASMLTGHALAGRAVLFRTGASRHFGSDAYGHDAVFLTADACEALVAAGVALVGIDGGNVDDVTDPARPAHTILLGAGVPICEHMTNLAALPPSGGRLHAVPIAWVGGASFPVRAYVVLDRASP